MIIVTETAAALKGFIAKAPLNNLARMMVLRVMRTGLSVMVGMRHSRAIVAESAPNSVPQPARSARTLLGHLLRCQA